MYYVIYLNGTEAARIGEIYQDGFCYRRMYDSDGNFLATLEVVLEDLVAVSFIESEENVQKVLRNLGQVGFAGTSYDVCGYTDKECSEYVREISRGIIQREKCGKSMGVVRLEVSVIGDWNDWFLETDDAENPLPSDEKNAISALRNYDLILVGNKWFAGKDAEAAVAEAFRIAANRKITVVTDAGKPIAEIYDAAPFSENFCDGKFRFKSEACGNIAENLDDLLEDGDTITFKWNGW